jgi:hypothetical protein
VIPTLVVVGVVVGRLPAVLIAAVTWPLLILWLGDIEWSDVPSAAGLAAANTAAGVVFRLWLNGMVTKLIASWRGKRN